MTELFILFILSFALIFGWAIFNAFLYVVYKMDGGKMGIVEYFKKEM